MKKPFNLGNSSVTLNLILSLRIWQAWLCRI